MRWFALVLLISVNLGGQNAKTPERIVQQNVLISARDPAIQLELPADSRYLGADRWILYGVADCEVHVWIEASPDKVVKRLYWVQFEAYLPERPEASYKYPFTEVKTIGGFPFDVRARFGTNTPPKPDSDADHVWKLIERGGYKPPHDMMNVRFVHLPDKAKRKELMIIVAEDLKPTGLTAADLEPGAKASDQWAALKNSLIERGAQSLKLSSR